MGTSAGRRRPAVNESASPSPLPGEGPAGSPESCVILTGPQAAGKTRWLQRRIRSLAAREPPVRCAVLLAEDGRTRMERFVQETPGVAVQKLFLPCFCCPAQAELEWAVRMLLAASRASRLYIELPAIAAPGLIAEFDRIFGWPRQVVVLMNDSWAAARREGRLMYFQSALLDLAGAVATGAEEADRLGDL